MSKFNELLPPNRIAIISGILLSIAAFVASLQTSFVPGSPSAEALAKAGAVIASILTVWRLVEKFLDGAQNWDSLMVAGVPKVRGVSAPVQGNDAAPVAEDTALSAELTAEGMAMYDEGSVDEPMTGGGGNAVLAAEELQPPPPRAVPPTLYDQGQEEPPR